MPARLDRHRLVIGRQLKKARETLAFSRDEVARELSVTSAELLSWEEERSQPTLDQLEQLARIYGRDVDYFLHDTPDPPAKYKFRVAPQQPLTALSPAARLAISRFEEICRKAVQIEQLLGKRRHVRLSRAASNESPVQLARRQREQLDLGDRPARGLRELLTKFGIRVFEVPVPSGEFSGLSSPNGAYGPRILINARDLFGRRHFTLAHEFAHLLYQHGASVCGISEGAPTSPAGMERAADLFAVEFLLPKGPLEDDVRLRGLSRRPSIQDLGKLAGRWLVSVPALGYRLQALKLIDEDHLGEVLTGYVEPVPHRKGPRRPSWQRQLGTEYVENALTAYRKGHISVGRLANCLGIPVRRAFEVAQPTEK